MTGIFLSWFSYDLMKHIGLIVIGLIIIFLIRPVLVLIPATIVGFLVWWFTGNTWWAGIAFLVIAALSILKKL